MIQFNKLEILSEESKLVIDVSVKDLDYYFDVYIGEIIIDTQDTFIESGPSSKPIYSKIITGNIKSVQLELDKGDLLSLNDNIFFVYIKTKGTPTPDTPCGKDNEITLGVAVNLYPIYQQAFNYIKELSNTCSIPKNFINYILQFKAFQLSLKTSHYVEAIKYWKKFYQNIKEYSITTNCNCHG